MLQAYVEAPFKLYDVCLASKIVRHQPYGNLSSLPIPMHRWKDLSTDFVTSLPVSTNSKGETYDSILVIVNQLTKIVHYEPIKITISALSLVKGINDVVVRHQGLQDSIVSDGGSVFTSKFLSSLYYFLEIKR